MQIPISEESRKCKDFNLMRRRISASSERWVWKRNLGHSAINFLSTIHKLKEGYFFSTAQGERILTPGKNATSSKVNSKGWKRHFPLFVPSLRPSWPIQWLWKTPKIWQSYTSGQYAQEMRRLECELKRMEGGVFPLFAASLLPHSMAKWKKHQKYDTLLNGCRPKSFFCPFVVTFLHLEVFRLHSVTSKC